MMTTNRRKDCDHFYTHPYPISIEFHQRERRQLCNCAKGDDQNEQQQHGVSGRAKGTTLKQYSFTCTYIQRQRQQPAHRASHTRIWIYIYTQLKMRQSHGEKEKRERKDQTR